jgi:hypothetical protein
LERRSAKGDPPQPSLPMKGGEQNGEISSLHLTVACLTYLFHPFTNINVVVYWDVYTCLGYHPPSCFNVSGSPTYQNCAYTTVPANTPCYSPYYVNITTLTKNMLCICGQQQTGGIHLVRATVSWDCDMERPPCSDLTGECGSGIAWDTTPTPCCGYHVNACLERDNSDPWCCL